MDSIKQINTKTDEGKLLFAALAILTTSPCLTVLKQEINGRQTTPDDMLQHLKDLLDEMDFRVEDSQNPHRTMEELDRLLPSQKDATVDLLQDIISWEKDLSEYMSLEGKLKERYTIIKKP